MANKVETKVGACQCCANRRKQKLWQRQEQYGLYVCRYCSRNVYNEMPWEYRYKTNCTEADGDSIEEMCDQGTEVTFKTFFSHVNLKQVSEMLGYDFGRGGSFLHIKNDYHVRYNKSKFEGCPCYYLVWSAIEYVFVDMS